MSDTVPDRSSRLKLFTDSYSVVCVSLAVLKIKSLHYITSKSGMFAAVFRICLIRLRFFLLIAYSLS